MPSRCGCDGQRVRRFGGARVRPASRTGREWVHQSAGQPRLHSDRPRRGKWPCVVRQRASSARRRALASGGRGARTPRR
eukprot:1749975-Pleurochrysis_carterae.AAC.1